MLSGRLRILLLLLLLGAPLVGVSIWQWNAIRTNPLAAALGALAYVILIAALAFPGKVWEDLQGRWSKSAADWIDIEVRLLFSPFRRSYYQTLRYRHRVFNVRGLRTQGTYTLELEKVFVDLRLAPQNPQAVSADLLHKGTSLGKLSIWDLLSSGVEAHKTLVIIGPPGSGKTTLLQHLILTYVDNAQRKYNRRARAFIPIFLFLRDHKQRIVSDSPPTLAELATEQESKLGPPDHWFKRKLERNKCLVLLDGLDEVADESDRRKVVEWTDKQIELFGGNRFIITSRPYGYKTSPLKNATVLEVQPLSIAQVKNFVENWYLANEILSFGKDDPGVRETAVKNATDMMRRLRSAPALSALAVNPLLLTMITMVHRYRGALPGRRVELYAEICDVLLGHWRSAIGLADPLTAGQKRAILQPLALYLMKNKRREIKTAEAADVIRESLKRVGSTASDDPVKFLQEVEKESGLLLEREVDEYTFAHQTFQEYLASVQLLETHDDLLLHQNVNDSWWHETIRLYAAQADATDIIRNCLAVSDDPVAALTLAYEISLEARSVELAIRNQLDNQLTAGLDSEDSDHRRLAAQVMLSRRLSHLLRISDTVEIDSSYISCAEYQLFIDDKLKQGDYHQPDHWKSTSFPDSCGREPVTGVRPSDARAFCDWLNERDSTKADSHYRLPTPNEVEQNPVEPPMGETPDNPLYSPQVGTWTQPAPSTVSGVRTRPSISALDLARDLDLDLDLDLGLDLARARGRANELAQALERTLDRARALDRERIESLLIMSILFLYNALFVQGSADQSKSLIRELTSGQRRGRKNNLENGRVKSLVICLSLLLLRERIIGNLSAWEGIRIVRERIEPEHE